MGALTGSDAGASAAREPIAGWGRLPVRAGRLVRPERLALPPADGAPVLGRGLGRAYGDAAVPAAEDTLVIGSARADRILAFDPAAGRFTCEAGCSLDDIVRVFLPRGWFPPVTPGTRFVTVGGMVAADVHGKNHHRDGSFGRFIEGLTIHSPTGAVACGPDRERELFLATVGGMGLTGLVQEVTLRLRPVESPWLVEESEAVADLDAMLDGLRRSGHDWPYTVGWIDGLARGRALGRGILMRARHATRAEGPRLGRRGRGGACACPWTRRAGSCAPPHPRLQRAVPGRGTGRGGAGCLRVPRPSSIRWTRCATGTACTDGAASSSTSARSPARRAPGRWRGCSSGWPPRARRRSCRSSRTSARPSTPTSRSPWKAPRWPSTCRTGAGATEALVHALNAVVIEAGGRIYLAKDALTRREDFARMMPRLAEWQAVRDRWDPERRFRSGLSVRLSETPQKTSGTGGEGGLRGRDPRAWAAPWRASWPSGGTASSSSGGIATSSIAPPAISRPAGRRGRSARRCWTWRWPPASRKRWMPRTAPSARSTRSSSRAACTIARRSSPGMRRGSSVLLHVNFTGSAVLCQAAAERLAGRGGGTICVFSSVAGDRARRCNYAYGASKAGLSAFLEGLGHAYADRGVRVVCVKPGFVKTGMTEGLPVPPFAGEPDPVARRVLRAIDAGRPVVYAPGVWRRIMLAVRALPRAVMRRIRSDPASRCLWGRGSEQGCGPPGTGGDREEISMTGKPEKRRSRALCWSGGASSSP